MEILGYAFAAIIGLITIGAMLWGIGYALLVVVLFFKALFDRLRNAEDNYYSKHVDK